MRMMNGATSKKQNSHRKSDSYSIEMSNRNAIFKDITNQLLSPVSMTSACSGLK